MTGKGPGHQGAPQRKMPIIIRYIVHTLFRQTVYFQLLKVIISLFLPTAAAAYTDADEDDEEQNEAEGRGDDPVLDSAPSYLLVRVLGRTALQEGAAVLSPLASLPSGLDKLSHLEQNLPDAGRTTGGHLTEQF